MHSCRIPKILIPLHQLFTLFHSIYMRQSIYLFFLLLLLAIGTKAQTIVPSPVVTEQGKTVSVTYTGLPQNALLCLYKDEALLPLRTIYNVTESGNGSFLTESTLEPGHYKIRCEQNNIALDSAFFTVTDHPLQRKTWNICLLTDIHVMHPDLVKNQGTAYTGLLNSDRKMLAHSADVLNALTDSILSYRPDLVLIAGDLTKDGEYLSHELVLSHLQQLKEAGIPTLVIPGNHDIKNPNARYYDGDATYPARDILADEFAGLYHDYGYGDNVQRDPNSLSYLAEPFPGICVLGIDATRWYDNLSIQHGDAANKTVADGQIREETLQWILQQADLAQADGKTVIAMMHHQLLQHIYMQEQLMPSAAITQGDSISRIFMQHGIHLVLTGHMHTSDITTYYNEALTDSIVEITTGSAIAYPCPYRLLRLSAWGDEIDVQTRYIRSLDTIPDFMRYGREEMTRHIPQITRSLTFTMLNRIDEICQSSSTIKDIFYQLFGWLPADRNITAAMVCQYLGEPISLALLTHNEANEHLKQTDTIPALVQTGMEQMLDKMMEEQYEPYERQIRIKAIMNLFKPQMDALLTSMLNDITYYDTEFANQTDDLYIRLLLPVSQRHTTDCLSPAETDKTDKVWYDILGRRLTAPPTQSGIYIHGQQKVFVP